MAKYDKVFNSDKKLEEPLSTEEALAAVAVVTAVADSSLEDVDVELLVDVLWGFEIFEDYSDDDLFEIVDRLIAIAEDNSVGALFNTAKQSLSDDLVLDAFAGGVSVLIDEDELRVPKGKTTLLKKLQEALNLNDEQAKEIIEEVIAAFEEAEAELLEDDDEDETLPDEDGNQLYESPSGNFTVPIPVDVQQGGRVQSQQGLVGFSDDFGTMLQIDYHAIPEQEAKQRSRAAQEKYLKSILLDKYVPEAIVANLPGASVEHTEYLKDIFTGAYFALVNMPEGSTISKTGNNGTATRLNAKRGLLAFSEGNFIYIVSSQRSFSNGETPGSVEQEAEEIKQSVLNFVDTIEFT